MSGTIELDRDGHHLMIAFPYRPDLVSKVRDLPERRWDKGLKVWRVPATHAELVVTTFMADGFEMSPEVSAILAGTQDVAPKPVKKPRPGTGEQPLLEGVAIESSGPLTITQLNERVRAALRDAFPGTVQVIGELIEFDKNRERRNIFFRLVEKTQVGDRPAATVDVALFERTAQRILPELQGHGLELRDGIEILIEAKIDLYPATGRYQLIVEAVRPEFTLGKLAVTRARILEKLAAAGLLRRNLDLVLPVPLLRIGVLTSPDSDGWNDFWHELEGSGRGFDVTLYPVRVQGAELEPTMLAGLRWFAARADRFDVLCVIRGGGSRTDLAFFDNEKVAIAVAEHPLKVLCGIGHERDRSVLDEIAGSLKTPTALAAYLVECRREIEDELRTLSLGVRDACQQRLDDAARMLGTAGARLRRDVQERLLGAGHELHMRAAQLTTGVRALLRELRRDLAESACGVGRSALRRLTDERRSVQRAGELLGARALVCCTAAQAMLDAAAARQRLLDPKSVLRRGFAMVRRGETLVTDARHLAAGEVAEIQFRDGRATTVVRTIALDEEPTPDGNA